MITFNATRAEVDKIGLIADRADSLGIGYARMDMLMDIEAAHGSCPLDLEKLLTAPDFDFAHDVVGIRAHINRQDGTLGDCFLPRCAKGQS